MDRTVHDMRNHLAVAIASVEALADGKLEADGKTLGAILASLEALNTMLSDLRPARFSASPFESESLLGAIVEGSPFAKILVDAHGRIALVNAQTEILFGYTRDEMLNQSIEMLIPERFQSGHPRLRDDFSKKPIARPMGAGRDLYGRRKDGSEVPIEIGLNPIKTDSATYTLAAINDLTERKRAEELRFLHLSVTQHAEELEELNRELANASRFKTQFVATMSHELRTPLTAIVGAAELLSKATLGERERISVETINGAAEALFSVINSILDFSKIEAGKLDLQIAPFEIDRIVEGSAEVVAGLAHEKGIKFHSYVDPTIPRILGDAERLRQILLNLLGNAVKFTERGHIVLSAVSLYRLASDIVVRFEVQDSGIGISPDTLPKLFEPFSQADGLRGKGGGTGLGLSISKHLVELMGGEIGVQSTFGVGSAFWFTARFGVCESTESREKTLIGVAALVFSTDAVFAEIVDRYLGSWEIESRRATRREDVLEALQSNSSATWVAIVDLDDIALADTGITVGILQAVLPSRIIAVGDNGLLRKPIRQSLLFDAIAVAAYPNSEERKDSKEAGFAGSSPIVAHVLVAEDNVQLQQLLRLQFDDLGVRGTFVSDGAQAIEALRSGDYSMVFMDCQMPIMDGLTATNAIRETERQSGGHVPICAMTANAFLEDRNACIAAGMDDYLAKPVRLAELRAAIERWSKRDVTR